MSDFERQYKLLNPAQRQAVDTIDGPVLVIAGAGTGKTSVIVERICKLIGKGTPPKRILALTFTEKAAVEMLDRVNLQQGTYELEIPLMTFNAFGESLLRKYSSDIGLGRNFTVLGESAQIVFLRERIDQLGLEYFAPLTRPDSLLGDIASHFSFLKQRVITPEQYKKHVKAIPVLEPGEQLNRIKYTELAEAYEKYLQLCREANVIDYDDQIYLTIDLFNRRPNVLKEVQDSFDYIMVDEFQDTNIMQSVLVDMIAGPKKNLFVVGDDDQSIYGWRGATLANILDFKERYPHAREITLVQNYRSVKEILDSTYQLIQHNNPHRLETKLNIDKKLVSKRLGNAPQVCSFKTLDEELSWIAEDINKRIQNGTPAGDIAVLARRNATIDLLHAHLDYAEIEHVVAGQRHELYHDLAVRMLLEALQATVDPQNNTSLYHTLIGPLFKLHASDISSLSSLARREHQPLVDVIMNSKEPSLEPARQAVTQIQAWREKIGTTTVGQLSYAILDDSGYLANLQQTATSDAYAATAANRLSNLFKTMKEFEQIAIMPSAAQYVDALPALQAAGEGVEDSTLDLSGKYVNVLTIHKSKGLEWPIVYIADCSEGSFPLRETSRGIGLPTGLISKHESEADAHMAEERRLMYVAMTRAKDTLLLTYSEQHSLNSTRKPSRFLEEALNHNNFPLLDISGHKGFTSMVSYATTHLPEVSIPKTILDNDNVRLSVSQAKCYIDCPLEFYYRYVLNIPEEPSSSLHYGLLMHKLVEDINRSLMEGKLLPFEELQAYLKDHWSNTGYLSSRHKERSLRQAKTTLESFYKKAASNPRIPILIEDPFTFTIKDAKLSIRGRFDAVFPLGNSVEIVDYKTTGSIDNPEKAKRRASSSDQLSMYALAWSKAHNELPALVSLDFIDTGLTGSVKKTQCGIDTMHTKLMVVAEGIRAHDFKPGKDHKFCKHPVL